MFAHFRPPSDAATWVASTERREHPMARTSRPASRAAERHAGDREPSGRAGGPAAPSAPSGRLRPHPLFVTANSELLDDLLRLAAHAGVTADVAPDPAGARPWFVDAALVLVGSDMAEPCARAGLPRRSGVVVVARRPPDTQAPILGGPRGMDSPWYSTPAWDWDFGGDTRKTPVGGTGDGENATWPPPEHPVWTEAQRLGADHVAVLPIAEAWLVEQLAHASPSITSGRVVSVLGGRGGAGASVLAGALAMTASRQGLRTML